MAKLTKKQKKLAESVDTQKIYGVDEAIKPVKANATAKFDETVEVALNLASIRATQTRWSAASSPCPRTGKTVRVGVFARGDKAEEATSRRCRRRRCRGPGGVRPGRQDRVRPRHRDPRHDGPRSAVSARCWAPRA